MIIKKLKHQYYDKMNPSWKQLLSLRLGDKIMDTTIKNKNAVGVVVDTMGGNIRKNRVDNIVIVHFKFPDDPSSNFKRGFRLEQYISKGRLKPVMP